MTEEQEELVKLNSDKQFDDALKEKVDEVVRKAQFLAKLEVPEAFKQAKREGDIIKIGRALSSAISGGVSD